MMYDRGYREGRKLLAPKPVIFNSMHRLVRKMTEIEAAEYLAGWNSGKRSVNATAMQKLGYR